MFLPPPPLVKPTTTDLTPCVKVKEGGRKGWGCAAVSASHRVKSPLPHPQQSKGLYCMTPGQPVRGLCKGNSPPGPGVIHSLRGLAGISCYVIWVLQITTTQPRLSLSSLWGHVCSWVTSCPAALQRLGLALRMPTVSQHKGMHWEPRVGQLRGQQTPSSRLWGSYGSA